MLQGSPALWELREGQILVLLYIIFICSTIDKEEFIRMSFNAIKKHGWHTHIAEVNYNLQHQIQCRQMKPDPFSHRVLVCTWAMFLYTLR